jgi:fumarate reductase flavoprotein subunit
MTGRRSPDPLRRALLAGGLGGAVAAALPGALARASAEEFDLAIVGAGTAGLPAAIFAARQGARVVVLEKTARIGGTLWFSGGQMSAAGTALQRRLGIDDSPEAHLADIRRISRGTAVEEVVRTAVTHAGPTVDWLLAAGLPVVDGHPTVGTGHEPYATRRILGPPERGVATLRVLEAELARLERPPTLLLETEVVEPILEGARVAGVVARGPDGARRDVRARAVVLASGGHNGNPAMFERLTGVPLYRQGWVAPNTGIGIELGLAAGGYARGAENYLCDFGSIPAGTDWPSLEFARSIHHPDRRPPWEVYVNVRGQRFVAEDTPSVDTRERALVEQPGHRYFSVFDEGILSAAPPLVRLAPPASGTWSHAELRAAFGRHPAFFTGESPEALAAAIGVPAEALAETIARYNAACTGAREDEFGRRHLPRPFGTPPYYAILHQGSTLISIAGLAVDGELRVIRESGRPVEGLYAAGELIGNGTLSGKAFCGGMMVTPALTFGRLLGQRLGAV